MTMLSLALTLICLASWGAAQSTDGCPAAVPRNEYLKVNGALCYEFILDYPLDFTTAESTCRSHGGTLLLVKSKDVANYIIDQLTVEYSNANKIWIGLSDRAKEGTFEWDDGTPLGEYTNWAPNNGPSHNATSALVTDCVSFDPNKGGLWEEDNCSNRIFGIFLHERPFVCQYRLRGVTVPPG